METEVHCMPVAAQSASLLWNFLVERESCVPILHITVTVAFFAGNLSWK